MKKDRATERSLRVLKIVIMLFMVAMTLQLFDRHLSIEAPRTGINFSLAQASY